MSKSQTFFGNVWNDHFIANLDEGIALLQIDRLFLHELNGSAMINKLEKAGRRPDSPGQAFAVVDHPISIRPGRGRDETAVLGRVELIRSMRRLSSDHGISLVPALAARSFGQDHTARQS